MPDPKKSQEPEAGTVKPLYVKTTLSTSSFLIRLNNNV